MSALVNFLKKLYHTLPEPPGSYYAFRDAAVNPYEMLPEKPIIFDIGSKDARGDYSFGLPPAGAKVICVDIEAGPGVDLVADAHNMTEVEDNSVDCTGLASMAKLKAGRLGREVTDSCLQYFGGMGFTWENAVSRAYRDVRLVSIGGGADEIMLGIICKLMGTLPGKVKVPAEPLQ